MKTMFVWEYVYGLTDSYHDGGGALVIADDLELARKLLAKTDGVSESCGALKDSPAYSAPVEAVEDQVFIFRDAGCC